MHIIYCGRIGDVEDLERCSHTCRYRQKKNNVLHQWSLLYSFSYPQILTSVAIWEVRPLFRKSLDETAFERVFSTARIQRGNNGYPSKLYPVYNDPRYKLRKDQSRRIQCYSVEYRIDILSKRVSARGMKFKASVQIIVDTMKLIKFNFKSSQCRK